MLSPSSQRAWIEMTTTPGLCQSLRKSPSSQRAWIEIGLSGVFRQPLHVALLAEGVDRNLLYGCPYSYGCVALLAEGVDRNTLPCGSFALRHVSPSSQRAWIEISVKSTFSSLEKESPSSQRAWIEICHHRRCRRTSRVALLAEGVDRNFRYVPAGQRSIRSPSSQRAWIEILLVLGWV